VAQHHQPGPPVAIVSAAVAREKRTIWVSLDQDLAAALQARGESLSSQVNEAVRNELTRHRSHPARWSQN
jgi:uncharacterized protein (DUF4415 family)